MRNKFKIGFAVIVGAIAASLPVALSGSAAQTFTPDNLPLTILSQNARTITFGWTPVEGYGYVFKTQATADAPFVRVSQTNDPNRNSVRFAKGSYDYAVGALGEVAVGKASDIGPPPPPPDTQAPSVPTNLSSSGVTVSSFNVSWNASNDNVAVTGYEVSLDGAAVPESGLSHSFSGLECETTYLVGVSALDAANNQSNEATLNVTTLACPDTQAPTLPGNPSVSNRQQESLVLNWTASNDNVGVDHYNVFLNGNPVDEASGNSFSFTGLTCNTNYSVGVQAEDAAGNTSGVASVNTSTLACDNPPPGNNVVLTNQKYTCNGLVNLALVKVTVDSTHMVTPAVQIASGCTGTIGRIEIDNANGDGIHVGAFAHDLTVGGGYVRSPAGGCTLCGALHVDGIQFLGGERITFNNMDVNYQTASNSALYINQGSGGQQRPTDVVFNNSTFRRSPTRNRVVRIGDSVRSGITNSTVYWCGTGPTCDAPSADAIWYNGLATDPIPPGNGDWGSNTLIATGG